MKIIGHEKIIAFFDDVIANGALSQSYCFVGSEQMGKRATARHLAAKLLKISEEQSRRSGRDPDFTSGLDTHPDFYYICRQIDEKTEKLKKDISIAQARQIKEKLGRKSWFGGYQAIIIDEAEMLNEESANALLKSLEEAGKQRVFFLLTADDNELLPTIRSRCQMFYFSLVDIKTIEDGLIKLGYDGALAAEAAKLSWGRPGRAIRLVSDEEARKNFNAEIERWQKIEGLPATPATAPDMPDGSRGGRGGLAWRAGVPFYQKIKVVEDLFNEKADNFRASEKLSNALETWMVIWREKLLEKLKTGDKLSILQAAGLVDNFKKAQILLAQNINPRLIFEQILLSVS